MPGNQAVWFDNPCFFLRFCFCDLCDLISCECWNRQTAPSTEKNWPQEWVEFSFRLKKRGNIDISQQWEKKKCQAGGAVSKAHGLKVEMALDIASNCIFQHRKSAKQLNTTWLWTFRRTSKIDAGFKDVSRCLRWFNTEHTSFSHVFPMVFPSPPGGPARGGGARQGAGRLGGLCGALRCGAVARWSPKGPTGRWLMLPSGKWFKLPWWLMMVNDGIWWLMMVN